VRIWTVDEANAYLPRLRELIAAVRGAVATAASAGANGHGKAAAATTLAVKDALAELEEGDIILRDPDTGLADFHARGEDGVVYFLCWLPEEQELGWWHLPEDGFAGRKPLPRIPGQ
jgi:hypothetical protein